MFVLISFSPRGRPKKPAKPRRGRSLSPGARKTVNRKKFKEQLRKARLRFKGNYNGLLLYINKIAIVATLESIGVKKTGKNKRLIEQTVAAATSDFKNLIDTSARLSPKYKVELFDILGPELAEAFLKKIPSVRTQIFSIEEELVREENERDKKNR